MAYNIPCGAAIWPLCRCRGHLRRLSGVGALGSCRIFVFQAKYSTVRAPLQAFSSKIAEMPPRSRPWSGRTESSARTDNTTLCRAGPVCPAGAVGKKNPPVTALPCQPPLGKGAMDMVRGKGCGTAKSRGPAAHKKARREPSFFMCCGDGVWAYRFFRRGGQYRVPSLLKARMRQSTPRRSR